MRREQISRPRDGLGCQGAISGDEEGDPGVLDSRREKAAGALARGWRKQTADPGEDQAMPTYAYLCRKCGKKFDLTMSLSEREAKKVRCPKCSSLRVAPQIVNFYARTSKKS
jgi:putative FmdB family regulatory protein